MKSRVVGPDPAGLKARYVWAKRFAQRMIPHLTSEQFASEIQVKADGTPLTRLDIKIHQSFCYSLLRSQFRSDQIISEEAQNRFDPENPICWVLDPLDGTSNFAHRRLPYALSLGFLLGGNPVFGVIAKPRPKGFSVLSALSGSGLEIDGRPYTPPESRIQVGGIDLRYGSEDELLPGLPAILDRFRSIRISGSVACGLAEVAMGSLNFYAYSLPAVWDVAAGLAILREARRVSNLEELDLGALAENNFTLPLILAAADKEVFNEVVAILQGALKKDSDPKIIATVDLSGRPV